MILELNDLRIFIGVAKAGSISGAAEQLNYVQSNITARIKLLEERLRVPLLHRLSRGVMLTGPGQMLLGYAERIIALSNEAERALMDRDVPAGRLTVGSLETTAAIRLPGILADYHRSFPQVDLQVVTGMTEDLLSMVLDYTADVALVAGEVDHPDLASETIFQDELVLATGEVSDIEHDRKRTLIVFRRGCAYRARFEGWLRDSGYIPYQVMEFGTIDGILGCVRAGMGMTVLPRAVFKDTSGLVLHRLPDTVASIDTNLVTRRDIFETKALTEFRVTVRKLASSGDSIRL